MVKGAFDMIRERGKILVRGMGSLGEKYLHM